MTYSDEQQAGNVHPDESLKSHRAAKAPLHVFLKLDSGLRRPKTLKNQYCVAFCVFVCVCVFVYDVSLLLQLPGQQSYWQWGGRPLQTGRWQSVPPRDLPLWCQRTPRHTHTHTHTQRSCQSIKCVKWQEILKAIQIQKAVFILTYFVFLLKFHKAELVTSAFDTSLHFTAHQAVDSHVQESAFTQVCTVLNKWSTFRVEYFLFSATSYSDGNIVLFPQEQYFICNFSRNLNTKHMSFPPKTRLRQLSFAGFWLDTVRLYQ